LGQTWAGRAVLEELEEVGQNAARETKPPMLPFPLRPRPTTDNYVLSLGGEMIPSSNISIKNLEKDFFSV
jgi:hypothetical protein